jgi:alcohol dehydrogenase (cytochrome c)
MANVKASVRGLALSSLIVGALAISSVGSAAQPAAAGSEDPDNWPLFHRTANAWRYSPLDQINRENVKHLHVAWIHQGGDITHGRQETPIVIDGIIYSTTAYNRVAAIDGTTGKEIWRYQPKLDPLVNQILFTAYSRGVAVGLGKVFVATLDGRGITLDQRTGKELWSTQLTDFKNCQGCNFTSPPVLAGSVLTFGSIGGDLNTVGKIYGVDPETGKKLWEFSTIKQDPKSWPGESGKFGGGGAWMPGTYDPETDTVFYGTANAAPDYYGKEREGDNLYTDSVIALDPKTGALKWHRQEIKHDVWDFDSAYEVLMFKRDGKDLLVHLNKSGFVFVMNKKDGTLENAWPINETFNFAKGIDPKSGEMIDRKDPPVGEATTVCPNLQGARSWNPGAYSPKTGLWYTTPMDLCVEVTPVKEKQDPKDLLSPAFGTKGYRVTKVEGHPPGRLDARDPITGKLAWSVPFDIPSWGAVLATGGGLVFNGDPFGEVRAFDAKDGKQLWSFNTGSGLRSGIVSYRANGKQYILVPSGWGSWAATLFNDTFPPLANVNAASSLIAFTVD